jgi:hypothetical protein
VSALSELSAALGDTTSIVTSFSHHSHIILTSSCFLLLPLLESSSMDFWSTLPPWSTEREGKRYNRDSPDTAARCHVVSSHYLCAIQRRGSDRAEGCQRGLPTSAESMRAPFALSVHCYSLDVNGGLNSNK